MAAGYAFFAAELEALVGRAARVGRLDPYELLETYIELAPSEHGELTDSRRLDLAALTGALSALPSVFARAPRVLIVPRLAAFTHSPVAWPGGAAGILEDGTLLVEARFGLVSLLGLTAALCVVAHELDKARALRPPSPDDLLEPLPKPRADSGGEAATAVAPEPAPSAEGAADARGDADPPTSLHGLPASSEAATVASTAPVAAGLRSAGADAELAVMAFTLGVDETSLRHADAATGGTLLAVLAPSWDLPEIRVHADLDARALCRRVAARAERIGVALAEMGLTTRPLHLWLGPPSLTDCLSPYSRELRDVILAWAGAHPEHLGGDVENERDASEDAVYALTRDFLATDPRLAAERDEADRTVGLLRYAADGLAFEVVDLARVEPGAVDARLGAFVPPADAPVLLRLSLDLEDASGHGLRTLLALVGARVASVTVVLEGTALEAPAGSVLLPVALVRWADEQVLTLPGARPLELEDFAGLAAAVVTGGVSLSVPHTGLLSATHVRELARRQRVQAIDVGGAALFAALTDAAVSGALPATAALRWALVAGGRLPNGRQTVATIAGCSALAVCFLRRLLATPAARAGDRRERPRPAGAGRTLRLKA